MVNDAGSSVSGARWIVTHRQIRTLARRGFYFGLGILTTLGVGLTVAFGWPAYFRWLDELILGGLLMLLMLAMAQSGRVSLRVALASLGFWQYNAIVLFSFLLNNVSLLELFAGWRSLAQFYLFYLALVWVHVRQADVRHYFGGVLMALPMHVGLALRQYLALRGQTFYDDVTAGFGDGTANLLGYYCAIVAIVCLCQGLIAGRKLHLAFLLPLGAMWIVVSAIGSYLAFAVALLFAFVLTREFRRLGRMVSLALVVALGTIGLATYTTAHFDINLDSALLSPLRAVSRTNIDAYGNPGRLALLRETWQLIAERDATLLLGVGPGTVGTQLGDEIVPSNFALLSERSGAVFISSSYVHFLAELGLGGFGLIVSWFVGLVIMAGRAWRRADQAETRAWVLAFLMSLPLMLLGGFGEITWTFQPAVYPFVVLAAFVTSVVRRPRPATAHAMEADQHAG